MTILSRYIYRETFKFMCLLMVLIISIYAIIDFFEKVDNFMEEGVAVTKAIFYLMLKIPFIISQTAPVGLLLSLIIVLGLMNKNNEIIALKSSGVSVYTLLKPVIAIGMVFTVLLFFFSEIVVPIAMERANRIWLREVKNKPAVVLQEKNIWMSSNRSIVHINYFEPSSRMIYGVSLNYFDENFRLVRRIDARRGVYMDGKWWLHDLMEQVRESETGNYRVEFLESKQEPLGFAPGDLQRVVKKSEAMSFVELLHYIRKVESEGYDATRYRVDMHAKVAFPLACVILCLIGAAITLKNSRKETIPLGISMGIGTVFFYWILYSFCLSLGYGEMLPPVAAAWAANLVFFCLGVISLLNAD